MVVSYYTVKVFLIYFDNLLQIYVQEGGVNCSIADKPAEP